MSFIYDSLENDNHDDMIIKVSNSPQIRLDFSSSETPYMSNAFPLRSP